MKDYSKGRIYTIRCLTDETLIYVGSTIEPLSKRWGNHKRTSRQEGENRLLYRTINGNWSNWEIGLYELYPCSCVEELKKKEGEIIRLISTLNERIAGRTRKDWESDNKVKMTEYNKEYYPTYYEKNKDVINKKRREDYEKNKDDINKARREKKKALKNNIVIL